MTNYDTHGQIVFFKILAIPYILSLHRNKDIEEETHLSAIVGQPLVLTNQLLHQDDGRLEL